MDVVVVVLHEARNGLPLGAVVAITLADQRIKDVPQCRAPGQSVLVITDAPDNISLRDMRERFMEPLWNEGTQEIEQPRMTLLEWNQMTVQTRNAVSKESANHAIRIPWTAASAAKVIDHVWNLERTLGEIVAP